MGGEAFSCSRPLLVCFDKTTISQMCAHVYRKKRVSITCPPSTSEGWGFYHTLATMPEVFPSHPLSLCNTSEDERQESFFISIVKLESPESKVPQCQPLLDKGVGLTSHRCFLLASFLP
ncbi:hypothetical protein SRHO_G00292110 [Serrasalmus rhombeus]